MMNREAIERFYRQGRKPKIKIYRERLCPHCKGLLAEQFYGFLFRGTNNFFRSFARACQWAKAVQK